MAQISMNGHGSYEDDDAHLMNSSFYSSISMNTLDHAKNFRNSLIIKDPSDQSLAASMQSSGEFEESQLDVDESSVGSVKVDAKGEKEKEISTMQMKNSPSLSALAGILNEKSRQAEEKARMNRVIDESILEEEEEGEGNLPSNSDGIFSPTDSPNLIDINDTNSIAYPNIAQMTDSSVYEQPDFLSTPRLNPPMNRNSGQSNNPFLTDHQLLRGQEDPIFQVQPSIQEEPELESTIDTPPRRERRLSMLEIPAFETRPRSITTTELETSPAVQSSRIRHRSQSSLSFLEQSSFEDPPPMYTKDPSSTSALDLQRTSEGNAVDSDLPNANSDTPRTRSRATTLGGPAYDGRDTHYRSNTIANVGTQKLNENMDKTRFEKNNFQEKLDVQPKRKNLRSSRTTPLTSNNSSTQQRAVSAGPVLDQPSSQQPQSQKRRSIFSLFKKRNSKETTPKKSKQTNKRHSTFMPSTTLNSGTSVVSPSTPEKLTKKSHSTNTIFSTFRKHKDREDSTLLSLSTPPKKESQLDAISKESSSFSSGRREPYVLNESDGEKAKSEPWNECRPQVEDSQQVQNSDFDGTHLGNFQPHGSLLENTSFIQEEPTDLEKGSWRDEYVHNERTPLEGSQPLEGTDFNDPLARDFPKPMLPFLAKHDAGEALFPKSLDKHEVESIVSLERSRSVKSNRSHRRSLTDTLSVNAQNEGMYVMEASPAMISTPDLSKSPTGSILRNGRFESITPSTFDERIEATPFEKENSETIPQLTLSPQGESMGSIEGKFNQLVLLDDDDDEDGDDNDKNVDEINNIVPTSKTNTENCGSNYEKNNHQEQVQEAQSERAEDDQEFTTEMMEFASLINFGDGFNLDLEIPPNHYANSNTEYTPSLKQDSPRRITNAKPTFSLGSGFEPEHNDTTYEEMINPDDKNHESNVKQFEGRTPNSDGYGENGDIECINDKSYYAPTNEEIFAEQRYQGQPLESFTDIPNDLLDVIRSPSPNSNFHDFEPSHDQEVHRERHSFRDILTNTAHASEQQPNHRPISMSFKGLNAPSLNHNAYESPLFDSPVVTAEKLDSDSPMQPNARVNFSSKIVLYDTYNLEQYDRRPELATCNMLTPQLAQMIKAELNELKSEMEIHEASRCYTHFF
ncbi:hypothetical protein ZYGR_0AS06750 [Zygosaccharomyces rouxii]|uniref:Protein BNI4 n=1 Tax=Zygosaccharomyces rouxii TaxID=4956 RepID=A0A1Q3AI09_ZYGRO|nr:hypothetical protein ZYGR_0AS06750 [Zygosaccharomyces rouxii]